MKQRHIGRSFADTRSHLRIINLDPLATNHFETCGFLRSRAGIQYPDIQYHFLPLAVSYDGNAMANEHGFQAHVGPMRSKSRGHVRLASREALLWNGPVAALATLPLYNTTFDLMAGVIQGLAKTPSGHSLFLLASHGIALAVMLPATFCAGMTLPLITFALLRAGELPSLRVGPRGVRVPRRALDRWVARNTRRATGKSCGRNARRAPRAAD